MCIQGDGNLVQSGEESSENKTYQAGDTLYIEAEPGEMTTVEVVEYQGSLYYMSVLAEGEAAIGLPVKAIKFRNEKMTMRSKTVDETRKVLAMLLQAKGLELHQQMWANICNRYSPACVQIKLAARSKEYR